MKFTPRKIVLFCISTVSALMLLIGLAFTAITYDVGLGGTTGSDVKSALGANGFDLLSFEFPPLILQAMSIFYNVNIIDAFAASFGAFSLVMLLMSFVCIAVCVFGFVSKNYKKYDSKFDAIVILSTVLSGVYAIANIIMVAMINADCIKFLAKIEATIQDENVFTSSAWGLIIVQVILAIAYVLCSRFIPENEENTTAENDKEKKNKSFNLDALIKEEASVIEAIKGYYGLYVEGVISSADFIDKKGKLLQYSTTYIQARIAKNKYVVGSAVAEQIVVTLIKEYKQLMDNNIITSAEYISKKGELMNYII